MVYWTNDGKKVRRIIMTDRKINIKIENSTTLSIGIISLFILLALLNAISGGARLIDLTVEHVLIAIFWMVIIDISIVGIVVIIFAIIAIIAS